MPCLRTMKYAPNISQILQKNRLFKLNGLIKLQSNGLQKPPTRANCRKGSFGLQLWFFPPTLHSSCAIHSSVWLYTILLNSQINCCLHSDSLKARTMSYTESFLIPKGSSILLLKPVSQEKYVSILHRKSENLDSTLNSITCSCVTSLFTYKLELWSSLTKTSIMCSHPKLPLVQV